MIEIDLKIFLGFVVMGSGMVLLMAIERLFPNRKLDDVNDWWRNVVFINCIQVLMVVIGYFTWEKWLRFPGILNLGAYVTPAIGGMIAYLMNTWIFYWWHLVRHECHFLWITCHQLHHSPKRIETVTSFYKHPIEIFINSIILTILLYPVLGLTSESSIWLYALSAYGEYFYHMNIKTPHWIGYFFQRPESHHYHHNRNQRTHCWNFSDFPFFDMINGTFYNPNNKDTATGFSGNADEKIGPMLMCKDVVRPYKYPSKREILYTFICLTVLIIGCLNMAGFLISNPTMRGLAIVSTSSPLPLVFSSFNSVETFSLNFTVEVKLMNNQSLIIPLTRDIYSQIDGPYNRRNVYGAIFCYGAFFDKPEFIKLRQQVLDYAICQKKLNLNLPEYQQQLIDLHRVKKATIKVTSNTRGNENRQWLMDVEC